MCRVHSRPVLICIVKSENKRLDGCFQLYVTIQEPQSAGSSVIDAGQLSCRLGFRKALILGRAGDRPMGTPLRSLNRAFECQPRKMTRQTGKRRYPVLCRQEEEILDAALVEFADRTYNAVSMERLAECAGLSKAGIYAHFKAKEEIFHALLERTTKQICDFQGWLPDEDLTLPELVDVYLDRLYATFSSPATMSIYRLLLAESAELQSWCSVGATLRSRAEERAQLIIQRNIRRGVIRPGVLTEHFFPLALAPAVLWLGSSMLSRAVLPSRWCSYGMRTGNCCLSFCSLNERVTQKSRHPLGGLAIGFVVLLLTVWGALALWHQMPQHPAARWFATGVVCLRAVPSPCRWRLA